MTTAKVTNNGTATPVTLTGAQLKQLQMKGVWRTTSERYMHWRFIITADINLIVDMRDGQTMIPNWSSWETDTLIKTDEKVTLTFQ